MREIKFKTWNKKKKLMYDVIDLHRYNTDKTMQPSLAGYLHKYPVPPTAQILISEDKEKDFVLLQYTGLKDRHGKEIYEGDVVNIRENDYIIVFSERWGRYMAVDVDIINKWLEGGQPMGEEYDIFGFDEDEARQCVKIGNIYEKGDN